MVEEACHEEYHPLRSEIGWTPGILFMAPFSRSGGMATMDLCTPHLPLLKVGMDDSFIFGEASLARKRIAWTLHRTGRNDMSQQNSEMIPPSIVGSFHCSLIPFFGSLLFLLKRTVCARFFNFCPSNETVPEVYVFKCTVQSCARFWVFALVLRAFAGGFAHNFGSSRSY